jgi:ankyrin repeat protein
MPLVFDHFQPEINSIQYANHAFSYALYTVTGLGTALHEAAKTGRPETIIWLLDHGADMAILDGNRRTPVEVAERFGNLPAIECFKRNAGPSAPKM